VKNLPQRLLARLHGAENLRPPERTQ
jgi:hypothetical protein